MRRSILVVALWLGFAWPSMSAVVTIQNDYYQYRFDTANGLKLTALYSSFSGGDLLVDTSNGYLGALDDASGRSTLSAMNVTQVDQAAGETAFHLSGDRYQCVLRIAHDSAPPTTWTLNVTNTSGAGADLLLSFPILTGLSAPDDLVHTEIFHGHNGATFLRTPGTVRSRQGFSFPLMDMYHKTLGGLYLIVKDRTQILKGYDAIKTGYTTGWEDKDSNYSTEAKAADLFKFSQGCGFAVTYRKTFLPNQSTYQTQPATVGVHPGRWDAAWHNYRAWLDSVAPARPAPRWFREVFISKALHQQHYHAGDTYELEKNVKTFDGPYTLFSLNHWMDNRGDYNVRTDWGGPDPLKQAMAALRLNTSVRCDLYLEGSLASVTSQVGIAHGGDWPKLKSGIRSSTGGTSSEWSMCPGSGWREYLAQTIARVIEQTDPDVIYMDGVGLSYDTCEDTAHDHPYKDGWQVAVGKLFKTVADAADEVKPGIPLYSEFWSSDLNSRLVSGTFAPNVERGVNTTAAGSKLTLTGTNLFRFYFPDFKFMEIASQNEEAISMALFNGNGFHHFFDKTELYPFLNECTRVWGQNIDAWMAEEPEPLVDTGNDQVFMNKFPDSPKAIYTLWNVGGSNLTDAPLAVPSRDGFHCVDLFNHRELARNGENLLVDVPLKKVSIFAELPRRLAVHSLADGSFKASWSALSQPSLLVWARPIVPLEPATVVFEDNFDGAAGKIDAYKWIDMGYVSLTGNGTALFIKGHTNWSNFRNGFGWDYTKPHTFELAFRFPSYTGTIPTQDFFMAGNTEGNAPTQPNFEFYQYGKKTIVSYSYDVGSASLTSTDMKPMFKPDMAHEYNVIQLVTCKDWRRFYVNGKLYCEIPGAPASDPATRVALGIEGNDNLYMEADYVKVYEGDASPGGYGAGDWESQPVAVSIGANSVAFDPRTLFNADQFAEMSIQLLDGGQLVDEWVGLSPEPERNAAGPGWEFLK